MCVISSVPQPVLIVRISSVVRGASHSAGAVRQSIVPRRRRDALNGRSTLVETCLAGDAAHSASAVRPSTRASFDARRVRASSVDAGAGRCPRTNQRDYTIVAAHGERNAVAHVPLSHGGARVGDEERHRLCVAIYGPVSMEATSSTSPRWCSMAAHLRCVASSAHASSPLYTCIEWALTISRAGRVPLPASRANSLNAHRPRNHQHAQRR